FSERELFAEGVPEPRLLDGVAVQLADVLSDALTTLIGPRTVPNPIAGVDCARSLRAQVGVPRRRAASGGSGERLAVGVGAGKAAKVRPVAFAHPRHEER